MLQMADEILNHADDFLKKSKKNPRSVSLGAFKDLGSGMLGTVKGHSKQAGLRSSKQAGLRRSPGQAVLRSSSIAGF